MDNTIKNLQGQEVKSAHHFVNYEDKPKERFKKLLNHLNDQMKDKTKRIILGCGGYDIYSLKLEDSTHCWEQIGNIAQSVSNKIDYNLFTIDLYNYYYNHKELFF